MTSINLRLVLVVGACLFPGCTCNTTHEHPKEPTKTTVVETPPPSNTVVIEKQPPPASTTVITK